MGLEEWKNIASIAQSVLTGLSLLIGASWVYFRYIRQVEHHAYLLVDLDCDFLGVQGEFVLCQVTCSVENKGKVVYRISEGYISVYPIFPDHPAAVSVRGFGDLWLGERYSRSWFVREFDSLQYPQTRTIFTQLILVPRAAAFVRFYAKLKSPGPGIKDFNRERAFAVPNMDSSA